MVGLAAALAMHYLWPLVSHWVWGLADPFNCRMSQRRAAGDFLDSIHATTTSHPAAAVALTRRGRGSVRLVCLRVYTGKNALLAWAIVSSGALCYPCNTVCESAIMACLGRASEGTNGVVQTTPNNSALCPPALGPFSCGGAGDGRGNLTAARPVFGVVGRVLRCGRAACSPWSPT